MKTRLSKSIFAMFIGSGLAKTLSIVFLLVAVRVFTFQEYTSYRQALLIIGTVYPFLLLGTPVSFGYFFARSSNQKSLRDIYLVQTVIMLLLQGMIGIVLLISLKQEVSSVYNNKDISEFVVYISLILFLDVITSFYPFYLIIQDLSRKLVLINLIFESGRLLILISVSYYTGSVRVYFLFYLLLNLLKAIYVFSDSLRGINLLRVLKSVSKSSLCEQLKYAVPLGVSQVVVSLNRNIDKTLVSNRFDNNDYITYTNGSFELPLIPIITSSVNSVLFPEYSKILTEKSKSRNVTVLDIWNRSTRLVAFIILPITFVMITNAVFVVKTIFTDRYLAAVPIFQVLQLLTVTRLAYVGSLYNAANKSTRLLILSIVSLVVNVFIIYLGISQENLLLVSIFLVIAAFLSMLMMLIDVRRVYNVSIANVFPWLQIGAMMLIGVVLSFLFYLLSGIARDSISGLLNCVFQLLCTYLCYYLLIPSMKRDIRTIAKGMRRSK